MVNQSIINIAQIFASKGVRNIVLSPGSRSAPLTLAFVRHPGIKTRIVPDERSAAFIALGMALTLKQPVGLICTSGSAVLNYYPAVAEAFFQNIPLLIVTADRPKEWIGQMDGQTIYQTDVYKNHIKKSFELASDFTHKDSIWHSEKIISEAIEIAGEEPPGPVHINVPLREPLYPKNTEKFEYKHNIKLISSAKSEKVLGEDEWQNLLTILSQSKKMLVLAGQGVWNESIKSNLGALSQAVGIPILGDILSNLHGIEGVITHPDSFLIRKDDDLFKGLQPDLLITFGLSIISKNLKLFLRNNKPVNHWHVQEAGHYADTFQSLTKVLRVSPHYFFGELKERLSTTGDTNYKHEWNKLNRESIEKTDNFFKDKTFSEFEAVQMVLKNLPKKAMVHVANSMPIRYVNYIGVAEKDVKIWANRGTSGIDGCTSTAMGASFVFQGTVVLITGDMAFFYDRNAFWHNYPYDNLRVIVLNNHGGGIFGLIDGPGNLPEREEYFETRQQLKAENTAKDFGMEYHLCQSKKELESILPSFFLPHGRSAILEIETDKSINRSVFDEFRQFMS